MLLYQRLCKRGQEREREDNVYYEKHHIIPKCLGGKNNISNITILTAREHFIAHRLLCKNHINSQYPIRIKLSSAFNGMCSTNRTKRLLRSIDYENARKEFSKNHPMKDPDIKNKAKENSKDHHNKRKMLKQDALPFCYCGCGDKVKASHYKYLFNHWDRYTAQKKGFTLEVKTRLSDIAKRRIMSLSESDKKQRLKKSLHSNEIDHIMRGRKISTSKKGKKTNQNEITGKRLSSMTDDMFEKYLKTKSHYVWNRFRKLREKWKNKL
jgi:hypothetical protein